MRFWAEGAAEPEGGQREGREMLQGQDLNAMEKETEELKLVSR